VRAAVHPTDPAAALDPPAAFAAHTVGGWRAAGRSGEGVLVPDAPATFAVWQATAQAGTGLPDLAPDRALPTCLATVSRGTVLYDASLLG
jgi:predicted amidohydrolase YtcJ